MTDIAGEAERGDLELTLHDADDDEARLRAAFEKDRQRAQQLRRNARATFRILLEGIRAQLCRREGIHSTVYYTWLID